MASALEPSDLEAILAPIAGEQPVGTDLRQDVTPNSIYFRLRDARAEARDAERQADAQGGDEAIPTLWRPVVTLAVTALKEASKDLEVATWLTEGLVRIDGLTGLAAGATVIAGLADRFWETVFPLPDEDGMETRVAAVAGLSGQGYDGTLLQPLRKTVLFRRPDGAPFTLWQYEATLDLSGIADQARRTQRIEAGVVPFEDMEKEARLVGAAQWTALRAQVTQAIAPWQEMGRVLDEKAGPASPSGNRVRELLDRMVEACNRFAPPEEAPLAAEEEPTGGQAAAPNAAPAVAPGAIMGREQALRQLGEIAGWFRRNEPNSPISYTLDEAVRRGRMTWPELVAELIPDEAARNAVLNSLGIKPGTGEP